MYVYRDEHMCCIWYKYAYVSKRGMCVSIGMNVWLYVRMCVYSVECVYMWIKHMWIKHEFSSMSKGMNMHAGLFLIHCLFSSLNPQQ